MQIIPFEFESMQVRVIQDDKGDLWWIVADVCDLLGLTNPTEAIRSLDDDEKCTLRISEGGPERNIINEAGLYALIMRSTKPAAKKFKRWVTHEVLPAIRKTGRYDVALSSELDLIIRTAHAMKQIENKAIAIENKTIEQDQRLALLEAKSHQNSGQTGYWTITAWCKLNRLSLSLDEAMQKGRQTAKLSKEWGAEIGKVHDERFGVVNSYREDVLEEVFAMESATL